MLSQLVTAAKELISLRKTTITDSNPTGTAPEETAAADQAMVTTRRQSAVQVVIPAQQVEDNGSAEVNGKRKSESTATTVNDEMQRNKRRKRTTARAIEEEGKQDMKEEPAPKKHFRFDSEEPEPILAEDADQEVPEDVQAENQDVEDSSDDEAPETVDNSAQLAKIKSEAKKREQAKQLEEQLRKEKRRQLDEARKAQVKASGKRKEATVPHSAPGAGTPVEDLLSESSATLQGSFTQDARHPTTLPALLPDDILNAVPDVRPPTPPPETQAVDQKKPTKLRFLDKQEKGPKDVRMGDVAIRVLGGGSSKKPNTALPPKASKTGRSARETWLKQARSTGHVNGMRMVNSGSKGFVRK
ncbi:U3 snoRNA associated-domain-containing protein [Aspergillus granulosus]|uniref:U3 snoRNA associated-domain-containing protein n=1 Tax=Aspergillus granulosus TaxID=176169 RepID=A0ABR4HXY9_9EURO